MTIAVGVAALWSSFVVAAAAALYRRRPRRLPAAPSTVWPGASPPPAPDGVRRRGRPGLRTAGIAIVVAMTTLTVSPLAAAPAAAALLLARKAAARRAERRIHAAVVAELPDVIALMVMAIGAGMTITRAVDAVGRRGWGRLAGELRRVAAEVAGGRRLADCLEELPTRVGDGVRPLTAALLSSERYGTPILESLDRLAAETRADARRRSDEAARRAPVKLAFPLVICILPAFALLTVAPLLASALRGLRL